MNSDTFFISHVIERFLIYFLIVIEAIYFYNYSPNSYISFIYQLFAIYL